ncbi:S9 family peptidase [Cytobacillus depressus]|uniref:S9 family peptidase n=1 Tax=Cytobacillus depressus TaxID=1602942 RepID=A0A6L3V6S4_9BACI|nr:S9 family peptidase [Cytobacillus depressus]KAB2332102.1 S9 family peptidase [Cytobacillus depressus]
MDEKSLDPYLFVQTAKNPEYGPDGKKISFISDFMGLQQVWEIQQGDGRPAKTSFTMEGITFIKRIEGTSDMIIGVDANGDERVQLYLLKENGDPIALTNSPEHVHLFGGISPDGKWIAWSSNRRNQAFFDIYIQNLETRESRFVFGQDGMLTVVKWFPDGHSLLVKKSNSSLDHDLGALSLLTGAIDWITEHLGEASFKDVHFNKDGDHIYLLSNKDQEFFGLAFIHLSTKHFTWLERGKWDFEELAMNKEKNKLAFTMNEGGISRGYLLDLDRSTLYTWETPMGVITNLKFSPDNQKLAYVLNGPAHPSDIWELDLKTVQAKRLTYISRTPILEQKLIEPDLITFRSFDNLQIPAFYYKPKDATQKRPIVVYIHGGPESQSRAVYNPLLQYFLNVGYAVVAPNIRGSTGYGKTYTHLDDVRKRMDALKDLIFLVEWLKGDENIDTNKIAVMGGSYGGFMALAAISHYPNLWAAAIDTAGISSFRTYLKTTSPWRKKLREAEYGTIEKDGGFFDQIDPLYYADNITSPLMVVHGANDPRVPIEESEQIVNKLKVRNHPVVYIRMEDEGHSFKKIKNKIYSYSNMASFLEHYMGNK